MLAPPVPADPTAEPRLGCVERCERVDAGAAKVLFRVTLAPGFLSTAEAAAARLIAADGGATRRCRALPAPSPAGAGPVTLGFAIAKTAVPLGLELGGRVLALPDPDASLAGAEGQLHAARSSLARARAACALAQIERDEAARARDAAIRERGEALRERNEAQRTRDAALRAGKEALRAATRAEAAAHDASERAASLARQPPTAASSPARSGPSSPARGGSSLPARGGPTSPAGGGSASPARGGSSLPARGGPTSPARSGPMSPARGGPSSPVRGARRTPRRTAGAAFAVGSATLLVGVLAWPARDGTSDRGAGDVAVASAVDARIVPAPAVDPLAARLGIPARYLALYRRAGTRYGLDWTRLAAVGAIESGHGLAPAAGILAGANSRGASGPAQFLPGTWERFGVDGNADGRRDPYDPADAIPAMASYLRASGAPQDWAAALRAYNHSDDYVTSVETLAASLRRSGAT